MTGLSAERDGRAHPGVDAILDLVVFAPAGLVIAAVEEVPRLVARGRGAVGPRLTNAHSVGKMAVTFGRKEIERRIGTAGRSPGPLRAERPPGAPGPGVPPREEGAPTAEPAPEAAAAGPVVTPEPPPAGTLAIPDYDALSASQVVHRLDGLSRGELEAVRAYEAATRGRRTILGRIDQLLG